MFISFQQITFKLGSSTNLKALFSMGSTDDSCTPSNPKKYSSPGLKKKIHRREMLSKKIMRLENSPLPPHS